MMLMIRLGIMMPLLALLSAGKPYVPDTGKRVRPEMTVIATEERNGYDCSYVEFSAPGTKGRKDRIRAYLLVPEGASDSDRHPAVLMLHDHGARFDIGKEKLVKPMERILPEGADDSFFLCRELIDGYLDGITGVYGPPEGYFVSEEACEVFDRAFPPKVKLKLPGQLV